MCHATDIKGVLFDVYMVHLKKGLVETIDSIFSIAYVRAVNSLAPPAPLPGVEGPRLSVNLLTVFCLVKVYTEICTKFRDQLDFQQISDFKLDFCMDSISLISKLQKSVDPCS